MIRHKFASISALMDADELGQVDDTTFDTELWLFLIERIASPRDADRFGMPVILYYASRFMQWEVGNGSFAQAAYNIPEWFEFAATAYDELGLPRFSALIREAMTLLPLENRETTFDAEEIGELFDQFAESKLARLDDRLDDGWEADALRLQYVRSNRQAFRDAA